jgi:alanyl-tRNA synthetase
LGASSFVALGTAHGGKGSIVGVLTKDLVSSGLSASDLILTGARHLGGGGSRDPELAQAGGPDGSKLGVALEMIRTEAERALAGP